MKTFQDLGLIFNEGDDCATCYDSSCHNLAEQKISGTEYNVHISTNNSRDSFRIHATQVTNTHDSDEIEEEFKSEEEAVKFICSNFNGFKCF